MYILNTQQISEWDQFTIQHEPITAIDLMERASLACVTWIENQNWKEHAFRVFCGKGNNGADGLAIARLLSEKKFTVSVCIIETGNNVSENFEKNLQRLKAYPDVFIQTIYAREQFTLINTGDILIDALFGTGIHLPLPQLTESLIEHINHSKAIVVAIDLPSGLLPDKSSMSNKVIEAEYTLTFQCFKLALLMQENASYFGQVQVLDIGLHQNFTTTANINRVMISSHLIRQIYKPRPTFSHKGHFGHALLVAGSYGKMGAAVLTANACIRSGIGLLTCYIPASGYSIMQTAVPEAMVITDTNENSIAHLPSEIEKYNVIGLGPGLGTSAETIRLISFIIRRCTTPIIIDADGLNCIALQPTLLQHLPPLSVLTPHPKEFDRLFGTHANDFERLATAENKAKEHQVIIILKSHHSLIATPDGTSYFNNTGNAGMAKGGSGDVLTGILIALAAQYEMVPASILATYLHGASGDLAANALSMEAMTASDLVSFLSPAFLQLN